MSSAGFWQKTTLANQYCNVYGGFLSFEFSSFVLRTPPDLDTSGAPALSVQPVGREVAKARPGDCAGSKNSKNRILPVTIDDGGSASGALLGPNRCHKTSLGAIKTFMLTKHKL